MFGRLTYDSLPFYSPIAFSGAAAEVLAGITIIGLVLYFKLVGYFWNNWLTSVDHKRVGIMYMVLGVVALLRGFADAIMMRTQQAVALNGEGYLTSDHFGQVFTAHGTLMIFFVAMVMVTGLINIVMPLQIGSRDVAFPFLNNVSFYLTAAGAFLVFASLVVGDFSTAGWTGYPPYSGAQASPGTGVEYWLWALILSGIGTTLSSVNFIATILRKRAPGMTLMRMPLFTWTAFIASILMLFAFPALTVATGLLELDRLVGTHFFTNEMGGNMMLYINLLWIWGHPEVYILILPAFGVFSDVVSTFCRKKLFGYKTMVAATAAIGILSFTVWLHHFFTMGSSALVNTVFGIATMIISIPTGIKVFHWMFTMRKGRITYSPAMMWVVVFIFLFVIGGMTGVMLAIPPVDYLVHNSTFLIAHFHNMVIPGVLYGMLCGIMYWFPKAFGFSLNEKWGRYTVYCWVIGFILAFFPLYLTGLMGMSRRLQHYTDPALLPYLLVALVGVLFILGGIVSLITMIVVSIRDRHALVDKSGDPWDGRTLEWMTSSPPPPYNFAVIPQVKSIDDFWYRKVHHVAYQLPAKFEDIIMPRNTSIGVIIGAAAFLMAFGITFYMWWLAIISFITVIVAVIVRSFEKDTTYVITAAEVEKLERAHIQSGRAITDARAKARTEQDKLGYREQDIAKGRTAHGH